MLTFPLNFSSISFSFLNIFFTIPIFVSSPIVASPIFNVNVSFKIFVLILNSPFFPSNLILPKKNGEFKLYSPPITNNGLKFSSLPLISLFNTFIISNSSFTLCSLIEFSSLIFSSTPTLLRSIVIVYV